MILEELKQIAPVNGVLKISEVDELYETTIFKIKILENRIYSDDEMKLLPFASKLNTHKEEWDLKAKSFLRFKKYLAQKKSGLNILDLGCGTGWFASKILKEQNHNFYCVDINFTDLKQGAKVYSSDNIKFIHADIFAVKFPRSSFDIILLNSSIQYFPDLSVLMRELFYLLTPYGEIHIIDSPFYEDDEVNIAKKQTYRYYDMIGFPQMKEKHFHHTYKNLKSFNFTFLYDPRTLTNKIISLAFSNDAPNPWIMLKR